MKQSVWNAMNGRPQGEAHADMPDSIEDCRATRANLGRAADQCDHEPTESGPNRFQPLAPGDKCDCPTDENRRAEIDQPAHLKIEDRKPIYWDERRIRSRQKNFPYRPQNETGNEVGCCEKKERGQAEHRPRRSDAPGLELALPYFEPWSWKDVLMKCRPNHVCRRAKVATAGVEKRLPFRAVALSPGTWIQTDKQVSEPVIHTHKASNLCSPALVNCRRGVSFARRTRAPSAVMR